MSVPIVVAITTYDSGDGQRTAVAQQALSTLKNLNYDNLIWYINDDSLYDDNILELSKIVSFDKIYRSMGRGVGYGKNTMLRDAFEITPYVLLTEDDWSLNTDKLNLPSMIDLLENKLDVGIIRLGYLGGGMTASYESYEFTNYWRLHRGTGVYIYSGQISLRHKRFYDVVGYHPEGLSAGQEELEMCKKFNATENAPDNIWLANNPSGLNEGFFINVGMNCSTNGVMPK